MLPASSHPLCLSLVLSPSLFSFSFDLLSPPNLPSSFSPSDLAPSPYFFTSTHLHTYPYLPPSHKVLQMTADCIFQANKLAVPPPLVPHTTLQMMTGNPEVFQQLWSVDVPQDKMMANQMAGFKFLVLFCSVQCVSSHVSYLND